MEIKNSIEENFEEKNKSSNIDKLLYLKQQKNLTERVQHLIEKCKQIPQLQQNVIKLSYNKWSIIDNSIESLQSEIDTYVQEFIIPLQENNQNLNNLENSLISISPQNNIIGKIGNFFERFIPGITRAGRQKIKLEKEKQIITSEIVANEIKIKKNPFKVFGANKDAKQQLLDKMDVTQLDKYSSMKNNPQNYLKPNNSVKLIADNIKREDMTILLDSYPALSGESDRLVNDLISNGLEGFNKTVEQIFKDSIKDRDDLLSKIDLEADEKHNSIFISDRITHQIQNIMDHLTPDELDELKERELQGKPSDEFEFNEQ